MKRIVICFDGTWNTPADENLPEEQQVETNVRRFYESVHETGADGIEQKTWYDQGVGTHGFDRVTGGTTGAGLEFNIVEGYKALADTYQDGDEVYIIGFSRGAYTARSLVGMIRNCGLIKKGHLGDFRIAMAYGIYRTKDDGVDSWTARLFRSRFSREIKIKFLGVWDTVGALGVPLEFLNKLNMELYEFHDTGLSGIVENAYQAMAIDENRKDYDVCLWDPSEKSNQTIEQRWFIGAHCDVGGGYPDRRLSDIALRWMQDRASELGLTLTPRDVPENNHLGPFTDSYEGFLKGHYAKTRRAPSRARSSPRRSARGRRTSTIGRFGSCRPERARRRAFETASIAASWPTTRSWRRSSMWTSFSTSPSSSLSVGIPVHCATTAAMSSSSTSSLTIGASLRLRPLGQLAFELGQEAVADLRDAGEVAVALGALRLHAELVDLPRDLLDAVEDVLLVRPPSRELVASGLRLGELLLERLACRRRLLRHRGELDLELRDAALGLVELDRRGVDLHAEARGRFVDEVDRLVGQEAVQDVAVGGHCGRDERGVADADAVVRFVTLLEAARGPNRVCDRRLADEDRLEAPLERRVFLDVAPVLVERRRADRAELAARSIGLSRLPAETAPSAAPAPTIVWSSSMKRTIWPRSR